LVLQTSNLSSNGSLVYPSFKKYADYTYSDKNITSLLFIPIFKVIHKLKTSDMT